MRYALDLLAITIGFFVLVALSLFVAAGAIRVLAEPEGVTCASTTSSVRG